MNIEKKLSKYGGYIPNSLNKWKSQLNTSEKCIKKILDYLLIIDSREIRNLLRKVVANNIKLIEEENCFICSFGDIGKSGGILLYEFKHTFQNYSKKVIEYWQIPSLPEKSKIVFLDDLVGTGSQSTKYINENINLLINPSHEIYILCLCATPQGINYVHKNTNLKIITALLLNPNVYQYLNKKCNLFKKSEKEFLMELNKKLHDPKAGYYEYLGLLLAFYFSVPNNTMPFIWKDKAKYMNEEGQKKEWLALLPRNY